MRGHPWVLRLSGYGLFRPEHAIPRPGRRRRGGRGRPPRHRARGRQSGVRRAGQRRLRRVRARGRRHGRADAREPDLEQAAAIPIAALAALHGLRDVARVRPGQSILIIGASGGVGTFAVQIAKALGAVVTGVCSTRNLDLVRSIRADHVVDYTVDDVTRGAARFDVSSTTSPATPSARCAGSSRPAARSCPTAPAAGSAASSTPSRCRRSSPRRCGRSSRRRPGRTCSPSPSWPRPARSPRSSTGRSR